MPIQKVAGGYRWGRHGHVYANRADAEKQAAAVYANGYQGNPLSTGSKIGLGIVGLVLLTGILYRAAENSPNTSV